MESAVMNRWVFAIIVIALSAVVLAGPLVLGNALGLDARTRANAAYETLDHDYGLLPVSEVHKAMKAADGPESATGEVLELTPGSTSTDVPFFRDGAEVTCTVHVPDDASKTTADCG